MEFGLQNYDPRGRVVTNKTELGDVVAKAFEPIEPVAGRSDFYNASVYAVALHRILSSEEFDEIIDEVSFEVIQHPDNVLSASNFLGYRRSRSIDSLMGQIFVQPPAELHSSLFH